MNMADMVQEIYNKMVSDGVADADLKPILNREFNMSTYHDGYAQIPAIPYKKIKLKNRSGSNTAYGYKADGTKVTIGNFSGSYVEYDISNYIYLSFVNTNNVAGAGVYYMFTG